MGSTQPSRRNLRLLLPPNLQIPPPALATTLQSVIAADFTRPELRAINGAPGNDARQSAQAKIPALNAHITDASRHWAAQTAQAAYDENKAELNKLGIDFSGGTK